MKTKVHVLVAIVMGSFLPLIAQAAPPAKVPQGSGTPTETQQTMAANGAVIPKFKVILKSGIEKTLKNASVKKVEPDGILFAHEDGLTKIPFDNLPPEFRKKYGYDPKKAKTFAAEEEKREAAIQEARARAQEAMAYDREVVRLARQGYYKNSGANIDKQAAADKARRSQPNQGTVTDPKPEDFSDPAQSAMLMARYAPAAMANTSAKMLAEQALRLQGADQQSDSNYPKSFADGYREGYAKANHFGICPLSPLPPVGHNTYTDGVGYGYVQGMNDAKRH